MTSTTATDPTLGIDLVHYEAAVRHEAPAALAGVPRQTLYLAGIALVLATGEPPAHRAVSERDAVRRITGRPLPPRTVARIAAHARRYLTPHVLHADSADVT